MKIIRANSSSFKEEIAPLLNRSSFDKEIDRGVAAILEDVKSRGDAALCEYARKFDKADLTPKQFKVELPSVSIKVDPRQADLLETRVIDGKSYLLIPIEGDIAVNGQPVFAVK